MAQRQSTNQAKQEQTKKSKADTPVRPTEEIKVAEKQ